MVDTTHSTDPILFPVPCAAAPNANNAGVTLRCGECDMLNQVPFAPPGPVRCRGCSTLLARVALAA